MISSIRLPYLTCRQRKLKCSEDRPICAQCAKGNRACLASQRITFRHQQNPSMNGDPKLSENLKSFYGYKETFRQETTWVAVPTELQFVHTNNPFEDEVGKREEGVQGQRAAGTGLEQRTDPRRLGEQSSHTTYPSYATHGLEALSAVASRDEYHYAPPPATMAAEGSLPVTQNRDAELTRPPSAKPPSRTNIDPQLHSSPVSYHSSTNVRTSSRSSFRDTSLPFPRTLDPQTQRKAEIAFLLRDFSERAGAWMDLFELGQFFAMQVPIMAKQTPLLLYSCVALSAKCLARVNGRKPVMGGQICPRRRSSIETWPGSPLSVEGWVTKAREFYDLAVSLIRHALAGAPRPPTVMNIIENDFATKVGPLPSTESDELVAAIAVLCVYEFLDASTPEWSQHLDGAKSLFELAQDRMVPLTLPPSPMSLPKDLELLLNSGVSDITRTSPRKGPSKGRTAVFWNVARQDMLSAFINKGTTRLEADDLVTWKLAGLKVGPDGFIYPSNPTHSSYVPQCAMADDLICNALIWLQMKIVNFIAAAGQKTMQEHEYVNQWHDLDNQLRHWHDGLPDSFHPTVVQSARSDGFEEHWYARAMCASAMQHYHLACITLLNCAPRETLTGTARSPNGIMNLDTVLSGIRPSAEMPLNGNAAEREQAAVKHAKQIVFIDLARADEATRIHAVQPLWAAGMVLGSPDVGGEVSIEAQTWRELVVRQLKGIERDMGWASEYRVKELLSAWGVREGSETKEWIRN
ncbi:hypothetical protein B0A48_02238 [Cryoendolithus antarcticus]|uniref:Zn(2)-C6 fungal-type domain-containing protein n=1 Tax=Cryoendolithus antarcticus TaxID=1507870 RepID=A0A1V8TN90_9PEZI|nr:hypothetical protein B0A48_02238 [Cryoendolithus antarcticus]